MPIVSQGNSVVVNVGADEGLWIKSTGNAEVIVNQVYAGTPDSFNVTTDVLRVGFYGEPVTVSIRAVSGQAEYQNQQFSIQPITPDSSPLDVSLAVNGNTAESGKSKSKTAALPYSSQLLNGSSGVSAAANTSIGQMIMIPHEFVAVRIGYAHRGGSGPLTDAKFLVATTDDIGDLSMTQTIEGRKFAVPIKAGVEYNTISADGWKVVNFAGSPTVSAPDAGANNFSYIFSDLIQLQSVLLANGNSRFSGCFPLLVRMFAGTGQYTRGGLTGFAETDKFIAESGKNLILGCVKTGDAVATPSVIGTGVSLSFGNSASLPLIIQCYTSAGESRSILMAGDSRFAVSTQSPNESYRCTQFYLEGQAQANGVDYKCVSVSQGGVNTDVYNQRAIEYLDKGGFCHAAIYLGYSINNGAPTKAIMDNCKYRLVLLIEKCRQKNVVPIIIPAFPNGSGFTSEQAVLLNDFSKFCGSFGYPILDALNVYGNAPLYGWKADVQFDASHMTNEGYQDLAARCIALINANN